MNAACRAGVERIDELLDSGLRVRNDIEQLLERDHFAGSCVMSLSIVACVTSRVGNAGTSGGVAVP